MTKTIFGIYDKQMKDYLQIVMLDDQKSIGVYLNALVNDPKSPFWRQEIYYQVESLAEFDTTNGNFLSDKMCFSAPLDQFVDEEQRNLQIITQTLNYIPNGYYKMPMEQQEHVQQLIIDSAKEYVSKYLSKSQLELVKQKLDEEGEG